MKQNKQNLSSSLSFLLIIGIVIFAVSGLIAAPLSNMPTKITQPNGETINVFASGDEFYNYLHDENGYTIILNQEDGYYFYAEQSGDSLVAGNQMVTKGAEPEHIDKWLKVSERHYIARVREFRKLFDKPAFFDTYKGGDKLQGQQFANLNNIVICIKFADDLSTENTDYTFYDEMYNSKEKMSMWKYYQIVSNGKINVKSYIYPQKSENGTYGFYECEYPRGYYEPKSENNPIGYVNSSEGYRRMDTLFYHAINSVSHSIEQNINLDENSDGNVDNVSFIFTGKANSLGGMFWPHMNALVGIEARINGKRVMNYNVLIADYLKIKGVATVCHEFLHSLGAPDYYDYTDKTVPVGQWELMAHTTNEPNQCGAYVRHKYLKTIEDIPEITKSGRYTLNSVDKKNNNCYKVQSYDKNQYYVLEFRDTKHILDKNMPMPGLLVYRVNKQYFGSSDSIHQELYIYRPYIDGNPNGKIEWAPFSADEKRTVFNENTKPMPFLEDGSFGGLNIRNIGEVGETISFDIEITNPKPIITFPTNNCHLVLPKFTMKWKSYNPNYHSQVVISKDSNFNEIVIDTTLYDDGRFEVQLEENFAYYIKLREVLGDYKGEWSEPVEIKTLSNQHKLIQSEDFNKRLTLPLAWQARESDREVLWQVNALEYGKNNSKKAECLWGRVPNEEGVSNFITLAKIDTNLAINKVLYLSIFKDINTRNLRLKVFQSSQPNYNTDAKLIAIVNANIKDMPFSNIMDFERVGIQLDEGENLPYIIIKVEADSYNASSNNYVYLDDIEIYAEMKKDCSIYLLTPELNAINIEPDVKFSWSDDCSELHEVQISEDKDFSKIIFSEVTKDNYIKINLLKYNRSYYWRVQGLSDVSQKWSEIGAFVTATKFEKQGLPDSLTTQIVKPNSSVTAKIKLNQFGKYYINNRIMNSNDALLLYSQNDDMEYLMGYVNTDAEKSMIITTYADNYDTDEKDGYSTGENYIFKVWDSEMKVVRPASYNVFIGRDVFEAQSETVLDVVTGLNTNELEIALETGWNLISSNIVPSVTNMNNLHYELKNKGIILDKNLSISNSESSSKSKYLDYNQGYYIHWGDKPYKLKIKGDEIPKNDKFIKISGKGWNLIPYLRSDVVKVEQYFGKSVNSNIVMVKDLYGKIYYPPYINTLKKLEPGRAYLVYTSASIAVDYNFLHNVSDNTKYKDEMLEQNEYSNATRLKNLSNYSVLLFDIQGAKSGDEIAITLGTDNNSYCVGNARVENNLTYSIISGNDKLLKNTKYQTINGADKGDKLYIFSVKDNAIDFAKPFEIISIYDVLANKEITDLLFTPNGVYKVKVKMPNSSVKQEEVAMLYPNPANSLVYIDLGYSPDNDCEITIRDANSQVYQLQNSKIRILQSGIEVDISSLPAGTYFLELKNTILSKIYKFIKY